MVRQSFSSVVLGGGGSFEGTKPWSVFSGPLVVPSEGIEDLAVGKRQGTEDAQVVCGLSWGWPTRKFNRRVIGQ